MTEIKHEQPVNLTRETAHLLANLAEVAYWSKDNIQQYLAGDPNHIKGQFDFFDQRGPQAYIAGFRDKIVVVFRGTEASIWDWKTILNFLFRKNLGKQGKVHRGFFNAYCKLKKPVYERMKKLQGDQERLSEHHKRPVYITGHSMGGALASFFSEDLWSARTPKVPNTLVTFGTSRYGNSTYCRHIEKRCPYNYKFINSIDGVRDLITCLPPRWLGYDDAGSTLSFELSMLDAPKELSSLKIIKDLVHGLFARYMPGEWLQRPPSLKAHFTKDEYGYIAKLKPYEMEIE